MNEDRGAELIELETEDGTFLDKWVFPYVKEPALWPVAFAIIGHIDLVVAMAMLETIRNWSPLGAAGLFLMGGLSGRAVLGEWKKGGLGPIGITLGIIWSTSAALAWMADHYGLY